MKPHVSHTAFRRNAKPRIKDCCDKIIDEINDVGMGKVERSKGLAFVIYEGACRPAGVGTAVLPNIH